MDDELTGERTRAVLRNVAAYRDLCEKVRASGTHSLVFGVIMVGLGYVAYQARPNDPFTYLYLALGGAELAAGLLNKFRPSAEGVLVDGLVLFAFGGSHLLRQFLVWQGVRRGAVDPVSVMFGLFWLYQGFNHVRWYGALRRAFQERPTSDHLRWFDGLVYEVRTADPGADPQALDLPTRPRLRGKLLGDTAVFALPDGNVLIAARDNVDVTPDRGPEDGPAAAVEVEGIDFGRCPLDPANWKNYAAWKAEGTEPPVVRPRSDR